jgi:DSF synthase
MQHYDNNLKIAQTQGKHDYADMDIRCEEELGLAWLYMHAKPRPCFTSQLVLEIQDWFKSMVDPQVSGTWKPDYVVAASTVPGVFNLGGDLQLFSQVVQQGDRDTLMAYATACNDILFRCHTGHDADITTIALVQGDALGGGFEAAVANEVLIAERSAKMGLPDILFNLFPGAGAYSLLARKIGASMAEKLVLSGRLYSAEEMFDMGVVDILAEDGQGEIAVYDYIKREQRARNGYRGFRQAKRLVNPVTREELMQAAAIWVETAFKLEAKDLRMMDRLVTRQSSKVA